MTAGSPLCASFVPVWSTHACSVSPSGSLCALLARFHVLTLPGVRFVPVWLSTGRTVRLAWVRWLLWCGCDGLVWCFVASCVRIGGRPGRECVVCGHERGEAKQFGGGCS